MICIVLAQHRYRHVPQNGAQLTLTTWDAFGYYMYLPSILIYDDYKELKWVQGIDDKYHLTGGHLYQAGKAPNDNYVYKYFGGVALMQLPFFTAAHLMAPSLGYPQDGFSSPYQYVIALAALFYAFLGIFVLRRVLKKYFDDTTAAITILLLCLATNFIQYAAADSAQSHIYIFPLYALVLYTTIKWHERPTMFMSATTGYIIGLATICRPTEAIMLFIPLLWNTWNKAAAKEKWQVVKSHRPHIVAAALAGLLGILPQLLYWKSATGQWIFDVGSAWDFLTPHFQVLFGWEKGWFVYTPITILFIIGLFFMKKYPFRKSVLWFCVLNIYIIIAWRDWHYGGSYSTRALVQSYPVFALAFGAFVQHIQQNKLRWVFYAVGAYLIAVNLFQLEQYAKTILHFKDMNRQYYGAIYLDRNPTPRDMSLLDNDEVLCDANNYHHTILTKKNGDTVFKLAAGEKGIIFDDTLPAYVGAEAWVIAKTDVNVYDGFWQGYLNIELQKGDSVKKARARLANPICQNRQWNSYELHINIPEYFKNGEVNVYIEAQSANIDATTRDIEVQLLAK